jgi:hypothetical protein
MWSKNRDIAFATAGDYHQGCGYHMAAAQLNIVSDAERILEFSTGQLAA